MHGFNHWMQIEIFYQGVNTATRMMLDFSTNGTILEKSAKEAFEILNRLTNNDYQFPSNRRELVRQNTEIMAPNQTNAMATQLAELTFIVKTLQKSKETYEVKSQEATLKSLETQVGQFTQMLSVRPQGNLPSNSKVARGPSHEQCKVISHRSEADTYIETVPSKEAQVNKDELPVDATTSPDFVVSPVKSTTFDKVCKSEEICLPPPFPQRLRKQNNEYQFKKYLDNLKHVHINFPLVEAIEKMSNFVKTLIDAEREQLTMRANDQQVIHNSFKTLMSVDDLEECQFIRTCSNLRDSKDQSRRSTYAMDNMPTHLFPKDTEIPTLEVNMQCKENFPTTTIEDHEQSNGTTTLYEAERSNASTKSEESENATTTLMLEYESLNCSYPQLSRQSHDYILKQDDDILLIEYDEVMVKPFEFINKSPPSLQVFLEEPKLLDLKPSKVGYDCLGDDSRSMVIPQDISVAPKSLLMGIIVKSEENYGWKLEDFKRDSHSFNLHRIVAEDCYCNWLEQQLPRQRRLHPTIMEVNENELIKWNNSEVESMDGLQGNTKERHIHHGNARGIFCNPIDPNLFG
ncbi:hypothetical protein GQ457_04G013680 [Hibiscus cannabinus]